jgi:FkbM family methyltransferase
MNTLADKKYNVSLGCQVEGLADIYEEYIGYKEWGQFVDVGAFDCKNWSNVSQLIDIGWHGIFIEPDPEMIDACLKRYGDNPRIEIVQCAASNTVGAVKLYSGGSQSTIVPNIIDKYAKSKELKFSGLAKARSEGDYIFVSTRTLDSILEQHAHYDEIDVLSIDVEGAELLVLGGFDIGTWRPKVAIIEAYENRDGEEFLSENAPSINDYFDAAGYKKIYSDHINNVYVREAD